MLAFYMYVYWVYGLFANTGTVPFFLMIPVENA